MSRSEMLQLLRSEPGGGGGGGFSAVQQRRPALLQGPRVPPWSSYGAVLDHFVQSLADLGQVGPEGAFGLVERRQQLRV